MKWLDDSALIIGSAVSVELWSCDVMDRETGVLGFMRSSKSQAVQCEDEGELAQAYSWTAQWFLCMRSAYVRCAASGRRAEEHF